VLGVRLLKEAVPLSSTAGKEDGRSGPSLCFGGVERACLAQASDDDKRVELTLPA